MGRIVRSRAGRRTLVGVLAIGGMALAACAPVKPPADTPPPELPPICIPNNTGDPRALAEPAPTEPGCTPICLPGQEPPPDITANLQQPPAPTEPDCVPICQPSGGGGGSPEVAAQARQRCIRVPIPCLPGVDIPDCVNFCPPGQEPPAQEAFEPAAEVTRCTPLCVLIPPGSPGACERVPPDQK
jgi:hypothetical protein